MYHYFVQFVKMSEIMDSPLSDLQVHVDNYTITNDKLVSLILIHSLFSAMFNQGGLRSRKQNSSEFMILIQIFVNIWF